MLHYEKSYNLKNLLLNIALFFAFISLYAQSEKTTPYVDSLEKVAAHSVDTYTLIKTDALLCWLQRNRNPSDAINYGNNALNLINQNPKFDSIRPEILNYLGVVNRNKGAYSAAMTYYFDALKAAKKYENQIQIAYSNNNLGGLFTLKGDYNNAIKYMEKALLTFNLLKDKRGMSYVNINLGNLYRQNYDYETAIKYFDDAIDLKRQVKDSIGITTALNLKALSLFDNNNTEAAKKIYTQLQALYEQNQDSRGLSMVKIYLGKIALKNKDNQSALKHFQNAYSFTKDADYLQGQSITQTYIGYVYNHLGNRKKAFDYLYNGLKIAKEIGDTESLILAYKHLAEVFKGIQDFKQAYHYQTLYTKEFQHKYDHEVRERLIALRINNELDKSDEVNKLLADKNAEQSANLEHLNKMIRVYRIALLIMVVLLVLFVYRIVKLYKRNKNKLNDNEELKKANLELKEANSLRERFLSIIGHDLKNPFNSVLGLTSLLVEEWESIPETEKKYIINEVNGTGNTLYELMDNLLLWAKNQNQAIKIHKEVFDLNETIVDVYELFRNQASFKEIKLQMEIGEPKMVFADPNMINTVVRNLVSNAIKFTRKSGKILIEAKELPDEVEFCITDNGKGILPDDLKRILDDKTSYSTKGTANETGTGLGLLLVKDFIKQNKGIFWVDSKPGVGSQFCFRLPISEE